MRVAIFGDVHGNLEALEAVLEDACDQNCSDYACTGDLVGFCANPQECVDLIRSFSCPLVSGNWDLDVSGESDFSGLDKIGRHSALWTRRHLEEETRAYLRALPLVKSMDEDDLGLVHATLDTPGGFAYITNVNDVMAHFAYQFWNISFYGHTHTSRMWRKEGDGVVQEIVGESILVLGAHQIYAINVGSVSQSRDGDWRAAYVVFDTEERTVEPRRVEFDLELTNLKLRQSGIIYPGFL